MKAKNFCPLAVIFGYQSGSDEMTFVGRTGEIVISGFSHQLGEILRRCDGFRTIEEIRQAVLDEVGEEFDDLVKVLLKHKIIYDSRSLYHLFHQDSANPMVFSHDRGSDEIKILNQERRRKIPRENDASQFYGPASGPSNRALDLIGSCKTVRFFKNGKIVDSQFFGWLQSMYQVGDHRSTPFLGGPYPLEVYVALLRGLEKIKAGWYQYCPEEQVLAPMAIPLDRDALGRVLDTFALLEHALGVVFLAADFSRVVLQYANRGYRHALIEAGHAMQNACLYCALDGSLGMVEYGGFRDEEASRLLKLNYPNRCVLLSAIVGIPGQSSTVADWEKGITDLAWKLRNMLIGGERPVEWLWNGTLSSKGYTFPFHVATAKYGPMSRFMSKGASTRNLAFGTGRTVAEATAKALSEAFERYASGKIRVDVVRSENKLEGEVFDLCRIAPFSPEQAVMLDLSIRDADQQWQWCRGVRFQTGKDVYIPIDHVFYPLYQKDIGRKPCYRASSSGVSADIALEQAQESALLELIERDAIAVTWYSQRAVQALNIEGLDDSVQRRARYWRSCGRTVKILDITTDSVPVVLVIIAGKEYPCLASGASAAYSRVGAARKAFDEAEFMLISWRKGRRRIVEDPRKIRAPHEHGIFYFSPDRLGAIEWLLDALEKDSEEPSQKSDIFTTFDPVFVDVTPADWQCGLCVVRALSEQLLPLTFGYGSEHYRHLRLGMLGLRWAWGFPAQPHFFA